MLTRSEIDAFFENGYIIRKGALSATDIESYRSATDRILHKCRVEGLHTDHLRYIDGERDDIWTLAKIRIIGTDGALIFVADHRCDPA